MGRGGASVVWPARLCQTTLRISCVHIATQEYFLSAYQPTEDIPSWWLARAIRPACTASWTTPSCCRRPRPGLDTRRELWPDEVRIRVERLNLDAASFRQLERKHAGDGEKVRARGARHRGHPRQDAEPRDRLRRHARRHRRGGRAGVAARARRRRPSHHPGLADADAAGDRGRPGRLGRPRRAGAVRRLRRAVRPFDRRRDPRRPAGRAQPVGDGRLRRAGAHSTRGGYDVRRWP